MDLNSIFQKEWLSKPRVVCGIMTGTSLDGIDVALAEFSMFKGKCKMKPMGHYFKAFPEEFHELLFKIISEPIRISDVSTLHFALAHFYADAINEFLEHDVKTMSKIEAVGIHGQTVWHDSIGRVIAGINVPSSLQLGSASALANLINKPVVADFRSADIALGGQGAPLVPIFDYEFLADEIENRIVLNIGGIANVTLLPSGCPKERVVAFDTGPGNVFIDMAARRFFNKPYDKNGEIACKRKVTESLFEKLKQIPFIRQSPPKSTGRELFSENIFNELTEQHIKAGEHPENILRTFSEFTVWSIVENIKLFGIPNSNIIVSGGGSKNKYLMETLSQNLPQAKLATSDEIGIPSDSKEALCFAYLAYRTLGGLPGNLPSVTGAIREAVLGVVAFQ
jgi:anhydro-N-acetylmuramic acid kinase